MTDISAASAPASSGFKIPSLSAMGEALRKGDMGLAVGVLLILVILILPLPPILLDMALAVSIILSILILMTALFIQTPLVWWVNNQPAAQFPSIYIMI